MYSSILSWDLWVEWLGLQGLFEVPSHRHDGRLGVYHLSRRKRGKTLKYTYNVNKCQYDMVVKGVPKRWDTLRSECGTDPL